MLKHLINFIAVIMLLSSSVMAQIPDRVEPPFWWIGMKNSQLQLMVHGERIADFDVVVDYPGLILEATTKVDNPNYLFLDLNMQEIIHPGKVVIQFFKDGNLVGSYDYMLKARKNGSASREGFNSSDVIYLITPDRFSNGDPNNDQVEGMIELPNRYDKNGRHGGDIQGIINSLDYIQKLGFTAVWLNPILENNMTKVSYHGYSTTDFYKVDPRFGSNADYLRLNEELDKRGMKLIMDMIFNHCGSEHWWMKDMPMPNWINHYPDYQITSHRRTVNEDPHASQADKEAMVTGWFDSTMPDLNQKNPYMERYLIQNSIWWIENAGLEGIRQDTWPYPDKFMMARWTKAVLDEYPNFNIVGEEWSLNPAIVSYWQKDQQNNDHYSSGLPSLMDFPLQNAVSAALNHKETWDTGLIEIYEMLANDFLYTHPEELVIFPDNHDMSRFYVQVGEDTALLKMALAFFLTTRGIPQIYYGTEVLLRHKGSDHGDIRADFPGGWQNDSVNAFTGFGLIAEQKDMQNYISTILNWRKNKEVIHSGRLMHFVPENGLYTYFRYNEDETVMVILNKNNNEQILLPDRFKEIMKDYTRGRDIITGKNLSDLSGIHVPGKSAMIIELN